MRELNLRVRCLQDGTPPEVPCREGNVRREIAMSLPIEQMELVCCRTLSAGFIE